MPRHSSRRNMSCWTWTVALIAVSLVVVPQYLSPSRDDPCRLGDGCVKTFQAGRLAPKDLAAPTVATEFETTDTVTLSDGTTQLLARSSITQVNNLQQGSVLHADYTVLPSLVPADTVARIRKLLANELDFFDDDPDTVDAMPTYEFTISNLIDNRTDDQFHPDEPSLKYRDTHPQYRPARLALRQQLRELTRPLLEQRITPLVQRQYPDLCRNTTQGRRCTPCYSMIRRYKHGERQSHAPHHDGHALITVVVSLSNYDSEYNGGLYVSTAFGQRLYLGLNRGDGVMHQSNLLHGVQVLDKPSQPETTERWSWILWYRDSDECMDHGHEWFADCAFRQNDPICWQLHSTKFTSIPGQSQQDVMTKLVDYNMRAALGGSGTSAVKIARSYLKRLPTHLPYNETEAKRYLQMAIDSHHPDGHFGMAGLLVEEVARVERVGELTTDGRPPTWKDAQLARAVWHLEQAAKMEHAYSMFNLGIAHTYGYGIPNHKIDSMLARHWFVRSGLPEGYFVAAHQAQSIGDRQGFEQNMELAKTLGHFHPWRKEARERTGSGGAGGVDLNLPWPPAHDGRTPPVF